MGNFSLVATLGAFVVVTTLVVASHGSTSDADTELGNHTHKNIAREAAVTGLNMTLRQMVMDTASWSVNPAKYTFKDKKFQNAEFSTRVLADYSPPVVLDKCIIDTVDTISRAVTDVGWTHLINGTWVRTCSNPGPIPPFMKYVTISEKDMNLRGMPDTRSLSPPTNADIHTNSNMGVSGAPVVEGYGSYSDGYKCASGACDGFDPYDNPGGGESNVVWKAPVDIPPLVPSTYLPMAHHISPGTVELADVTLDFTNWAPPNDEVPDYGVQADMLAPGTADNPFIWYIRGDLDILKNTTVRIIGHGVIITEGAVHVNANANLYSSIPGDISDASALPPPEIPKKDPTDEQVQSVRDWYGQNVPDGMTLGIYSAGDIHLNGQGSDVMSYLFSNTDIHVNGQQVVYGAMTSRSAMQYNGSDVNVWYAGVNESIVLPGVVVILPEGIRMIAYSEW